MKDEAPFLVGFEPSRIAVGGSGHHAVAFLLQIARSEAPLTQRDAQQTGPDLLAADLQSSAARAAVKGGMAAFALQFIKPHLDPTLPTQPCHAPDRATAPSRWGRCA